ncbi:MAG: cytidylate kinase-like family protein [Ruminococcaceae bacterium]|nr:cytidylate kinase-like family protein [Oscillospiraceae bacterium]
MKNYIVTIARQYGSGGRLVGEKLSEITGFNFYDKNLITLAAQKSGLSSDALHTVDEKATNSLLYTLALGSSSYNHGIQNVNLPINDRLFVVQSEIIKELSEANEGAIIVGRCADYVLSGKPNVVRVFITADFNHRVEEVMARHDLNKSQAEDLIIKTDKRRANYYSYYTGEKWGKADKYDLVISTDRVGNDGAAQLIADYIKMLEEKNN